MIPMQEVTIAAAVREVVRDDDEQRRLQNRQQDIAALEAQSLSAQDNNKYTRNAKYEIEGIG